MSQGRHKDTLKCPKDTGTCSVCWATFKIHRSTGHVHRHGHRDSPCPGSDKPPISASLTQPPADTTKRHTDGVRTYKRGTVNRGTVKRGQLIAGQLIARTHNRADT